MKKYEICNSIKMVYGMLWDVLSLYETTECYNKVPQSADSRDIWEFMDSKIQTVRKEISQMFLGEHNLSERLLKIVDETEHFVRSYEKPGVVTRWKAINPRLLFFDCAFDVMDKNPEFYQAICWGLTDLKLSCHPDETLTSARNKYMAYMKQKIEKSNLRYSDERVFQDELLRTLTMVFEKDFAGIL